MRTLVLRPMHFLSPVNRENTYNLAVHPSQDFDSSYPTANRAQLLPTFFSVVGPCGVSTSSDSTYLVLTHKKWSHRNPRSVFPSEMPSVLLNTILPSLDDGAAPLFFQDTDQTLYMSRFLSRKTLFHVCAWTSPSAPDSNAALSVSLLVFSCQVYLKFPGTFSILLQP